MSRFGVFYFYHPLCSLESRLSVKEKKLRCNIVKVKLKPCNLEYNLETSIWTHMLLYLYLEEKYIYLLILYTVAMHTQ